MATTKFVKGELVKFKRNYLIFSESTPIIQAVKQTPIIEGQPERQDEEQAYILEHSLGWAPNPMRTKQFELDTSKKYIFVMEKELTKI